MLKTAARLLREHWLLAVILVLYVGFFVAAAIGEAF
jgi:hypothetical protein